MFTCLCSGERKACSQKLRIKGSGTCSEQFQVFPMVSFVTGLLSLSGSCWAFSTVDAIESYAKLSGKYGLQDLSTQQVVNCDHLSLGCGGGNTWSGYDTIVKQGGIELDKDYPYQPFVDIGKCRFNQSLINVTISGFKNIASNEASLLAATNNGPPSVVCKTKLELDLKTYVNVCCCCCSA